MYRIYALILSIALTISCSTKEEKDISFEGVSNSDFAQIISKAKVEDKAILLYFSSVACVNCRKIEELILGSPEVKEIILSNYLLVPLIVDDRSIARKRYWKFNELSKDTLKNVGEINSQLQIELTHYSSQPQFVILSKDKIALSAIGYTKNANEFLNFLE